MRASATVPSGEPAATAGGRVVPLGGQARHDRRSPRVPKYQRVASVVRDQIKDGTLKPGQAVPSGAALSRVTGFSVLTCRRGLGVLLAEGVLVEGASKSARLRVPRPGAECPGVVDVEGAARRLSTELAARRRAAGLTQPRLAGRVGKSVTTIGHAETGRVWQARDFWEICDEVLDAGGALLALRDAYDEAAAARGAADAGSLPASAPPAGLASSAPRTDEAGDADGRAMTPAMVRVTVAWSDGTVTSLGPGADAARVPRDPFYLGLLAGYLGLLAAAEPGRSTRPAKRHAEPALPRLAAVSAHLPSTTT